MPQIIVADNFPDSNIAERTTLIADSLAAATTLTAENPQNYALDDYVLVGEKGQETAQLAQVDVVTGAVITIDATLKAKHFRGEPLYRLRANNIKFYRAANVDGTPPDNGAYGAVATLLIDADQLTTSYLDSTGGSNYWYKYTFYNDTTASETDIADAVAQRGGNFGHYATEEDVRYEAGMGNNVYISPGFVQDRIADAESQVNGALAVAGYNLPLSETPPVVRNITKLLAAGYLLLTDYGDGAEGSNKEGKAKIKIAEKLLMSIQSRELVLVDIASTDLTQSSGINGWPLNSTADASEEDAGGAPFITSKRVF